MGQLADTQISLTERLTADSVMCYMKGDYEGAICFLSAVMNITGGAMPDGKPIPSLGSGIDLSGTLALQKYYLKCVPLVAKHLNSHYAEIRKDYRRNEIVF